MDNVSPNSAIGTSLKTESPKTKSPPNAEINLVDNPLVQELFGILKENNKDTAGLTALLSYVKQMEGFIKSAMGKYQR